MDPALKKQAHKLKILKAKAIAAGNIRAVKHYDFLLKKMFVTNGVIYDPAALKVKPDLHAQQVLISKKAKGVASLVRHKVPGWFRPGYDAMLRSHLWVRLAPAFRKSLLKQHEKGLLPEYYPSPSYWARKIKVSDFYLKEPTSVAVDDVIADDPNVLQETTPQEIAVVMDVAEDQLLDLIDETALLAAEAVEEKTVLTTLESTGEGKLAAEEPWYHDSSKVFVAAVAALLALVVIK